MTDTTRTLVRSYIKGDISLYKVAKELGCGNTTAYILVVRVLKEDYENGVLKIDN